MTTLEPGARLVFTHDFERSPRSTAFLASRPAAISTDGFDVFVQLVIAAITTLPSCIVARVPFAPITAVLGAAPSPSRKFFFTSGRLMRSCGRLGPAIDGTTFERSNEIVSLNTGS